MGNPRPKFIHSPHQREHYSRRDDPAVLHPEDPYAIHRKRSKVKKLHRRSNPTMDAVMRKERTARRRERVSDRVICALTGSAPRNRVIWEAFVDAGLAEES